jgi:hypothetical protein
MVERRVELFGSMTCEEMGDKEKLPVCCMVKRTSEFGSHPTPYLLVFSPMTPNAEYSLLEYKLLLCVKFRSGTKQLLEC